MPPPIRVVLVPHSTAWAQAAQAEGARLADVLRDDLVAVHHIGSTAIPGIHAKPIVDLMPVVRGLTAVDEKVALLRKLGYACWGEYGIAGRRYCTLDDPATGRRRFQLHCFEAGNHEIRRHLAFRDYLRTHSEVAQKYDAEKQRCQRLYPADSHKYSDAKAAWIVTHLAEALAWYDSE
ncbi:MAG: GrpB family protein [Pirellulaceae bacterium]